MGVGREHEEQQPLGARIPGDPDDVRRCVRTNLVRPTGHNSQNAIYDGHDDVTRAGENGGYKTREDERTEKIKNKNIFSLNFKLISICFISVWLRRSPYDERYIRIVFDF